MMVFAIAAFNFFKVSTVCHFCAAVLKWESKSKAREYNHCSVLSGISYLPFLIDYAVTTVRYIIIAIIILIWLETRLCN